MVIESTTPETTTVATELTATDITTALAALLNIKETAEVKRDIFQAEGEIKTRIGEASTAAQIATLNATISQLQSNAGLAQDIARSSTEAALGFGIVGKNVSDVAGILGVSVVNATAGTNNLVSTATNLLNTAIVKGFSDAATVTVNEAEKTRNLITSNYVADLNAKNVILANQVTELRGDCRSHEHATQAQTQSLLLQMIGDITATKQVVNNMGSGSVSGQTATAVKN
jgi:hypothetical protein